MEIKKKTARNKSITVKFTDDQDEKITVLAKKYGVAKSNLLYQLVAQAYQVTTKTKKDF
jgi:hypothetical protein